jgi:hypothetical protein
VSVSLNKVGDVLRAQSDLPGALANYREGLDIRRALAKADPSNMVWARDVWVSLWRLAQMDAGVTWVEVYGELRTMKERGVLLPDDERFLLEAQAKMA